jgi:hypothetical protein
LYSAREFARFSSHLHLNVVALEHMLLFWVNRFKLVRLKPQLCGFTSMTRRDILKICRSVWPDLLA